MTRKWKVINEKKPKQLLLQHREEDEATLERWEIFVPPTLVFVHFAFATLSFDILLLPHFSPLRGNNKLGKRKIKFNYFSFWFCTTERNNNSPFIRKRISTK
jgi:hypothetical protein